MSAPPRCRLCGDRVAPEAAPCGRPGCGSARVQARVRQVFQRDWAGHAAARAAGLAAGAPRLPPGFAGPVGVVPRQDRRIVPLPERRRAEFAAALDAALAEAGQPGPTARPAPATPEAEVVALACGLCQGACCTLGGAEAAFLSAPVLRLRLAEGWAPEALRAAYLARVPARSVAEACVYQGAGGCALPRTMRAPVCNLYHCNGLRDLATAMQGSQGGAAAVIAHDPGDGVAVGWIAV